MIDALQGQRGAPLQDPAGALQGHELAGIRQCAAAAWELDGLGDARGARDLASAPHWPARSPHDYSDVTIETGHLLRLAFGRPWRQTEGLLRSLVILFGVDVGILDHTTFSRRRPGLTLAMSLAQA